MAQYVPLEYVYSANGGAEGGKSKVGGEAIQVPNPNPDDPYPNYNDLRNRHNIPSPSLLSSVHAVYFCTAAAPDSILCIAERKESVWAQSKGDSLPTPKVSLI